MTETARTPLDNPTKNQSAEGDLVMLRNELWRRHGHSGAALYGDDGEMQCHECLLDFRRDPVTVIVQRLHDNDWERFQTAGNRE